MQNVKKRSLVVNLTHEITGTDVADKRICLIILNTKDRRWLMMFRSC